MKAKLYPAFLIIGTILLTSISLRQFFLRYCVQTERKPAEHTVLSAHSFLIHNFS
ncbi:MAG: hypothetical protein RSE13_16415 [Planktothrix sp. GU0601_MAG3]|nr:MAG: hypothetical protein RSE13_16415 [Planktothrix sp. GU0601_MAG3]